MNQENTSFQAGIDFESVLQIISKQVYETPLAFIRENVQNAVDAIRIQAHREGANPNANSYRIDITVKDKKIVVRDNGIGMSDSDLKNLFWTIGASGKRTQEALSAGCVGTFGIGGFANFGVCTKLEVISQTEDCEQGTLTRLSEEDIRAAANTIPSVSQEESNVAAPRGTVVIGNLRKTANVNELKTYLSDFVRFVPIAIHFNGEKISQKRFLQVDDQDNLTPIGVNTQKWHDGDFVITGRMFEDRGYTLVAAIENLCIAGEFVNLEGRLRFQNGSIDVFKRGFKLCATQIGCTIGVSGRLDCDRFVPTAGRDSPDAETTSLLSRIVLMLEKIAIDTVLGSSERIVQNARIFQYVVRNGLLNKLDNAVVRLADASEISLGDIRRKAQQGVVVFFGTTQKRALNQIMQARGHVVVLLSADRYRRDAERQYLEQYCAAKPFDGIIDCSERYQDLTRFEKIFLSELEFTISRSFEVENFHLIPGKLTEDIPVFLKEHGLGETLDIFVDVRHPEIAKLEVLGYTGILYSLISTFCREFLGPSLKKWSPRFFGDGALNFELLSKRRSELWTLVKDDIGVVLKGGQHDVVTSDDVQEVKVGEQSEPKLSKVKRLLHIVDEAGTTGIDGFYIRILDTAFKAYGDLLPACDNRGVVWAGNKITYVASDAVSAAFQYEIRLDKLVIANSNRPGQTEGAIELQRPVQEMFAGIYFPIPALLEPFLVPTGDQAIQLHLYCEWIDLLSAKLWLPREAAS
ncbi:MAG: ATP-binding protein [Candidatus Poribacteria bacterium]|nr:ATP-binding protein [Candidatus Poribacteria bacterium]